MPRNVSTPESVGPAVLAGLLSSIPSVSADFRGQLSRLFILERNFHAICFGRALKSDDGNGGDAKSDGYAIKFGRRGDSPWSKTTVISFTKD